MTADIAHGTYKGWNAHKRYDVPMCTACREAQRQYQASRREDPAIKAEDRIMVRAGELARSALARKHPEEYRSLYEHYKARLKKTA